MNRELCRQNGEENISRGWCGRKQGGKQPKLGLMWASQSLAHSGQEGSVSRGSGQVGPAGRRGVRGSSSGALPWERAGASSREAPHFPLPRNGTCPGLPALRRRVPRGSGMIDPETGFPALGDAVCA